MGNVQKETPPLNSRMHIQLTLIILKKYQFFQLQNFKLIILFLENLARSFQSVLIIRKKKNFLRKTIRKQNNRLIIAKNLFLQENCFKMFFLSIIFLDPKSFSCKLFRRPPSVNPLPYSKKRFLQVINQRLNHLSIVLSLLLLSLLTLSHLLLKLQ